MIKELERHIGYTLSLICIIGFGMFLALQTQYDKNLQIGVLFLTACFYVFAGIIHHSIEHDISYKIVVEYVLIGMIGISLIAFFLKGGF